MAVGQGAGWRAQQQVDRLTASAAELVQRLERVRGDLERWRAGAEGERAVAAVLDDLAESGWRSLHHVHWPGQPVANLNHVVVGPGGVVLVDAKNWSGRIDVVDGVPRRDGRHRTELPPEASTAAAATTAMLEPRHRAAVRTALCFVRGDLPPASARDGVTVLSLSHLPGWLLGLPAVLAPSEVSAVEQHLRRTLTADRSPALTTTAALQRVEGVPVHEPPAPARRRRTTAAPRSTPRPRAARPSRPSAGRARETGGLVAALLVVATAGGWLQSLPVDEGTMPATRVPSSSTTIPGQVSAP